MPTKSTNTLVYLCWVMAICMAIPTSVMAVRWAELEYLPVMRWFSITKAEHDATGVTISGEMYKARDCSTIGMTAYGANAELLNITFPNDAPGQAIKTRRIGLQPYENIRISPDTKELTLYVRHRCHFMWDSTTNLTALPDNEEEYNELRGKE